MISEKALRIAESRNDWQKLMALGEQTGMSPRSGHIAHLYQDQIIVFGGYTGKSVLNDAWLFDLNQQEWQNIFPSEGELLESEDKLIEHITRPSPRMSHAYCVDSEFNTRLYLFGGSGLNIGSENYNDLWEFNLITFKFTEIRGSTSKTASQNIPPGMYGHSLNCFKNNLYVFGGTTGYQYFKDVYKYDLIVNSWSKL